MRMQMDEQERIEVINKLMVFISERGRGFFRTEDTVAYMKLDGGCIYYVDSYTRQDIPVLNNWKSWDNFSLGGTLRALVMDFGEFIRTGVRCNGQHGYGGLHCSHWGHSEAIQREIIEYATELGYL